jgi:hypothetical protein
MTTNEPEEPMHHKYLPADVRTARAIETLGHNLKELTQLLQPLIEIATLYYTNQTTPQVTLEPLGRCDNHLGGVHPQHRNCRNWILVTTGTQPDNPE